MWLKATGRAEGPEHDEREEPQAEPSASVQARGYRVAGDLEVRAAELQQELTETRARFNVLERELWTARREARKQKALAKAAVMASQGRGGATLGSFLALLLYALDIVTSAPILFAIAIAGFALGVLLAPRQEGEDDNFPPAPPPRMY